MDGCRRDNEASTVRRRTDRGSRPVVRTPKAAAVLCRCPDAGGYVTELSAHQVGAALERLERRAGKRFGDQDDPLLVSVRSGARESMPGMLDTVLNLGLNDATVEGLARASGDERIDRRCRRRRRYAARQ